MRPIEKVYILPEVHKDIMGYVRNCHLEVSGIGTAVVEEDYICITDIFILPQECQLGYTKFKKGALTKFAMDKVKEGLDLKTVRFWWHSHVNGSVFWSGIDDGNVDEINSGGDYFVSTVFNKRGEMLTRIDSFYPFHLKRSGVETIVGLPIKREDNERYVTILKEMVEDVTPKKNYFAGGVVPAVSSRRVLPFPTGGEDEDEMEDISFYIAAAASTGEDLYDVLEREGLTINAESQVCKIDS